MNFLKQHWKLLTVGILLGLTFCIWFVVIRESPTNILTIAFLDVGQGDAIYIESPTHQQIIIDGGPSPKILGELRKVMPWYDRSIDMIIVTNPDADHYAGFINVLRSFAIKTVIEPGTYSNTETYKIFEEDVDKEHAQEIIARRGQVMDIGGGAYIKILFPDRDVSKLDSNEGSIIAQLVYGETEVMLTGDATSATEEYVVSLDGEKIRSDILKVSHHGSKTSSSENFVRTVNPQYAVISAGKKIAMATHIKKL